MQLPFESRWENAGLQRVHQSSPLVDLLNAWLNHGLRLRLTHGKMPHAILVTGLCVLREIWITLQNAYKKPGAIPFLIIATWITSAYADGCILAGSHLCAPYRIIL